jgi:cytochrome c oxidase subunit 3/cytochrome o ubiquinol oxidase subunit 3
LTAVLGSAFLGGQYIEYSELGRLQITLEKNIISEDSELVHAMEALGFTTEDARAELLDTIGGFGMRFYAPTAFHGAHVFVGVLWALLVLYRGSKGRYDHNPIGIELFGLYWHFVDVVWIMLFTLIYLI